MLDFAPLREKRITLAQLTAGLTAADLRRLTNAMIDRQLALIAGCYDPDVTFMPVDPQADDPYAASEGEKSIAWTLGHVIVHTTASAEEAAFLAAELARGVPNHGRSRWEVPWEMVTRVDQCRVRLEESRRMRLALLDAWPDAPRLDTVYQPEAWGGVTPEAQNAVMRFVRGLQHDDSHLGQMAEIVRQAQAARQPAA